MLRALVEMEAERLLYDGLITSKQRNAVSNINGHCLTSTVKDFYLLEDREADRREVENFFDHFEDKREKPVLAVRTQEQSVDPEIRTASRSTSNARSLFEARSISWGKHHPHGSVKSSKIPWSDAEKDYIGKIVEELKQERGKIPTNVCAIIKDRVFIDSEAHLIFHEHHTLDSTRIRSGYESYIAREEKKLQSTKNK
jgi:hypothetical protein